MGQNIANGFNTALSGINTALSEFDFKGTGKSIGTLLKETIKNIDWEEVGAFCIILSQDCLIQLQAFSRE